MMQHCKPKLNAQIQNEVEEMLIGIFMHQIWFNFETKENKNMKTLGLKNQPMCINIGKNDSHHIIHDYFGDASPYNKKIHKCYRLQKALFFKTIQIFVNMICVLFKRKITCMDFWVVFNLKMDNHFEKTCLLYVTIDVINEYCRLGSGPRHLNSYII